VLDFSHETVDAKLIDWPWLKVNADRLEELPIDSSTFYEPSEGTCLPGAGDLTEGSALLDELPVNGRKAFPPRPAGAKPKAKWEPLPSRRIRDIVEAAEKDGGQGCHTLLRLGQGCGRMAKRKAALEVNRGLDLVSIGPVKIWDILPS